MRISDSCWFKSNPSIEEVRGALRDARNFEQGLPFAVVWHNTTDTHKVVGIYTEETLPESGSLQGDVFVYIFPCDVAE